MVRQSWQERLLSRQTNRADEPDDEPRHGRRQEDGEKSAGIEKIGVAPVLAHTASEERAEADAAKDELIRGLEDQLEKMKRKVLDSNEKTMKVPRSLEKEASLIEHAPIAAYDPPTRVRPIAKRQWRRDSKDLAASDQPLNLAAALQIVTSKRAEQEVEREKSRAPQAVGSAENEAPFPENAPAVSSSDRLQGFGSAAREASFPEHRVQQDQVRERSVSSSDQLESFRSAACEAPFPEHRVQQDQVRQRSVSSDRLQRAAGEAPFPEHRERQGQVRERSVSSSDRLQHFRSAAGRREHRADHVEMNGPSSTGILDVASSSLHNLIPIAGKSESEEQDIKITAEDKVLDVASSSLHNLKPTGNKRSEEHQDIGIQADHTEENKAPPKRASGLAQHLFRHSMLRTKGADPATARQTEERHQNIYGPLSKEVFDVVSGSPRHPSGAQKSELHQDAVNHRGEEEKGSPVSKQPAPELPTDSLMQIVRRKLDKYKAQEVPWQQPPLIERYAFFPTERAVPAVDRQDPGEPQDTSCQDRAPHHQETVSQIEEHHQKTVSKTEELENTRLHNPLRSDQKAPSKASNFFKPRPGTDEWLVAPPTFENSDPHFWRVSEAKGSAENNSSSGDKEEEFSSDSSECEAWWEEQPQEAVYPSGDSFWEAGGLEFFSSFDSGNCAGVVVTPTVSRRSQAIEASPAEKLSADAIWASAAATESAKLLYEVVQMRCYVHAAPDLASKVVTKKSKGAKFFAGNRATSNGWQPLVGEKGWVCVLNSILPVGERIVARWISEWGGSAVKHYSEPELRFCKLILDAEPEEEKARCANKVVRVLIGGMYFLLRLDTLPSMRGTVLELEESLPETRKPASPSAAPQITPASDLETLSFDVRVRADCAGTPHATDDCQWFYFGVRGQPDSSIRKLRFRLLGLSRFKKFEASGVRKGPLATDGVRPLFRYCAAGAPASNTKTDTEWSFVDGNYGVEKMSDGTLACTFEHSLGGQLKEGAQLVFALTFPYPLARIREHVNMAHHQFKSAGAYVCREHLVNSLHGHPIELFTITARGGHRAHRQPPLVNLLNKSRRPRVFPGKKAIFVSCRVHPGETPASYMLEGLLDFLVSADPAASELLRRYVIHIIPVLNPDGVVLGHHRTDLLGENLNRVYGREAKLAIHPAIVAAQDACICAHKYQGGLRLYLDLHAHSNRRGAFLLGDADVQGGSAQAKARLFGYALCRRCSVFEFGQSDFKHAVAGTGKSGIRQLTGAPLCFTVESHYFRGHHSTIPFGPDTWRGIGRSCLEALLDCDRLEEKCLSPERSLQDSAHREDMRQALRWFTTDASNGGLTSKSVFDGPSRVCPRFGRVLRPLDNPLLDVTVEIIEHQWRSSGDSPAECWLRLHEAHGGIWVPSRDLELCDTQKGTFFYGVLTTATVSADPVRGRKVTARLPPGTVIEVEQRRTVEGFLRVLMTADASRGNVVGWLSEYKSSFFDPRLGGIPQLMRLNAPPVKSKTNGLFYAFSS